MFLEKILLKMGFLCAWVVESLHHMKNSCTGKKGFMAMKLDMSKAYDRVD